MRIKILTILIIILVSWHLNAQQYPIVIRPGETKTISANNDTLWVFKNSQANKALAIAKKYEICQKQINLYEQQVQNLKQQSAQRDSMYQSTKQMMETYQKNWDECRIALKAISKEYKKAVQKQKLITIGGIVISVASFALGAILF